MNLKLTLLSKISNLKLQDDKIRITYFVLQNM